LKFLGLLFELLLLLVLVLGRELELVLELVQSLLAQELV
jgi:hypothetical protein